MAFEPQISLPYCPVCGGQHSGPCTLASAIDSARLRLGGDDRVAHVRPPTIPQDVMELMREAETELRKFALDLANKTGGEGSASKGVVNRAENYLAFLKGEKLTDEAKSGSDQ